MPHLIGQFGLGLERVVGVAIGYFTDQRACHAGLRFIDQLLLIGHLNCERPAHGAELHAVIEIVLSGIDECTGRKLADAGTTAKTGAGRQHHDRQSEGPQPAAMNSTIHHDAVLGEPH